MRTLLSQFCESFDQVVRPLLEPLAGAAKAFTEASGDLPGKEIRAELLDLRHQVEGLVEKVSEQQAYVLIFGPLKSGKSTLMNALARTYVSEVSSLPAYPCMVYLSHSDKRQFDVTRYNGKAERFSDPSSLYVHINRAHTDLAERIRAAEEKGDQFDPPLHYPEAIRKVDVRLPAGDLERSGAVLVDTPGLYSRMRFGYDRMTREFRNTASCAIFIVKSDNLFLEQVFEEFEELLDLFSRIFLVVNLDTTKVDLSADGSLVPSLEAEDPLRIIDAFENLAMSAPLKEAAEEGRLRIYPVDLLRAASNRLKGSGDSTEPVRGQANFDAFLTDLTEYLNSTDYLVSFLGDSLRRARTLIEDTGALLEHDKVEELRRHTDELDAERQDVQKKRHAVQRLREYPWRKAFDELDDKLAPSIRDKARKASETTERALDNVIDRWFGSDASLKALVEDEMVPSLRAYQEELVHYVRQSLDEEVLSGTAGILLPTDVSADLYSGNVDLTAVGKDCLGRIEANTNLKAVAAPLSAGQVPVRRGILDWILFRSVNKVRGRIFGDAANPALRIPVEIKNTRIGREGKEAMRRELDLFKGRFFHETVQHVHRHVVGEYGKHCVERMDEVLTEKDKQLDQRLDSIVAQLMERRRVLAHLSTLATQKERASVAVEDLSTEYDSTEPEKLIQPVAAGDPVPVFRPSSELPPPLEFKPNAGETTPGGTPMGGSSGMPNSGLPSSGWIPEASKASIPAPQIPAPAVTSPAANGSISTGSTPIPPLPEVKKPMLPTSDGGGIPGGTLGGAPLGSPRTEPLKTEDQIMLEFDE